MHFSSSCQGVELFIGCLLSSRAWGLLDTGLLWRRVVPPGYGISSHMSRHGIKAAFVGTRRMGVPTVAAHGHRIDLTRDADMSGALASISKSPPASLLLPELALLDGRPRAAAESHAGWPIRRHRCTLGMVPAAKVAPRAVQTVPDLGLRLSTEDRGPQSHCLAADPTQEWLQPPSDGAMGQLKPCSCPGTGATQAGSVTLGLR